MTLLSIIILAIGLCMDSFAVSLTSGTLMQPFTLRRACKFALILALFQGLMPVVGWLLGIGFRELIESIDHWIALGLLLYLGGRMIIEAIRNEEQERFDPCCTRTAMTMGLATSIDAMAVGISLAMAGNVNIFLAVALIGVITFLMSALGVKIGNAFGSRFEKKAQLAGGVILILLGLKILLEHLGVIG